MRINLFRIPQAGPDDLSGLIDLVGSGQIDPAQIVAILGKTEGNGCVNDFTRGFAVQTLRHYLSGWVGSERAAEVVYVMSGGCEGVISPHLSIFTRAPDRGKDPIRRGLSLGIHHTRDFQPDEIGGLTMVQQVADGVRAALKQADLEPSEVHFVQIKCPLARAQDSYQSMARSRGASALGVAVALGEVDLDCLREADICSNFALYSGVASTSAGLELRNCEIVVLGNSSRSTSTLVIGHGVMRHALDLAAVQQAIASTGQPRIRAVFAKAEADPSGTILGRRHTMLGDSDISHTRMARAVVGAAIAALIQDPLIYVSGGSEHQGPPGGGPIAVIADQGE